MEDIKNKQYLLIEEVKDKRNSLTTDKLDMSYGEIISMYENEDIIINPEFQRLFRWNDEKKTRFIESILLGIPIPPIFVAEDSDGRWELVDGLQRVSTVMSFFGLLRGEENKEKNYWKLQEGELITNFEGMGIDDLPLLFKRNIKRAYCRVEILKWDSKVDMRYELFNRLNTGGESLTEQEIRNCIFRDVSDEFNKYLDRIAFNPKFKELMCVSKQKESEAYLQELVLRVSSLYDDWNNIKTKNISKYITQFMESSVKDGFNYDIEKIFERAIDVILPLGSSVFRFENNQLSTSLVDAIFVMTMRNIDYYENQDSSVLLEKINLLKSDSEFRRYVGSNSSSKSRVAKRLDRAFEIFKAE